jgi:hypothetical protein
MPDIYQTPKGVKIGLTYERPAPQMTPEEVEIQTALLKPKPVARLAWPLFCWIASVALVAFIFWSFK